MLATVLRGELAEQQSIFIMREEQKRFMEQEMIIVRFIRMITCL